MSYIREEVERIIKEQGLDRHRIFEVAKTKYAAIIRKTESIFVAQGGSIHWSNMGYFRPDIPIRNICVQNRQLWYHHLSEIILLKEEPVYVLLEDNQGYRPKYWLYEMYIPELITILDDIEGLNDFYIASKKYVWLISENHEEVIAFLGSGLNCSILDNNETEVN